MKGREVEADEAAQQAADKAEKEKKEKEAEQRGAANNESEFGDLPPVKSRKADEKKDDKDAGGPERAPGQGGNDAKMGAGGS